MNARKKNNNKTHICPNDGKRFSTKRALEQHRCMVHSAAAPATSPRRRGPRNGGSLSSDIAPSRIPAPPGNTITISGEDRVLAVDVGANKSIMQPISVGIGMSGRLSTISRAYQRVKWMMVEFIVTPQASATTNGGYVCGFVTDPTDDHITADVLSATQGALTKKWYETAICRMPPKPDLLYTSDSDEPRLSEPARFWIISEGKPSSSLTLIVTARWKVRLSNPSLENQTSDSFVLVGDLRSNKGQYALSYYPHCSNTPQDDVSSQIPARLKEIPGTHFFRVPTFTIEYEGEAGEILSDQMHYIVYKQADRKAYYSSDGKTINTTKWAEKAENQYLVPEGTFFKYVGMGNVCVAEVQGRHKLESKTFESFSIKLQRVESLLNELRSSSRRNSRTLERRSSDSTFELLEKPIEKASSP